jgi:hypothetical protein
MRPDHRRVDAAAGHAVPSDAAALRQDKLGWTPPPLPVAGVKTIVSTRDGENDPLRHANRRPPAKAPVIVDVSGKLFLGTRSAPHSSRTTIRRRS